ncbi:MucBP domain-containing protein [Lacticaseibacillus parakribbianus]|uniref:MucBP domain-containing protein n=1 Tax=Lacticaseibacillus parakribbianus TaxID=2970927 RepID=UPI0021CB1AAA|nr:MucBP domain-containing protein [Lacticaseibacillus parakribbianus]
MRQGIRRVKLYKAGKLWVACATVMVAGGVALVAAAPATRVGAAKATASSVLTTPIALSSQALPTAAQSANAAQTAAAQAGTAAAQTTQGEPTTGTTTATTAAPVVTTKDRNGNASVNPDRTGTGAVTTISDSNIADYFTVRDVAGKAKAFDGTKVQLTNGHENPFEPGQPAWTSGMILMLANQQVDFTTDFALNVTMNVAWDPSMGHLGGDGSALFFEPLSQADAFRTDKVQTGGGLGLTDIDAAKADTMSFNLSTNAIGALTSGPQNHWYAYRSNGNNKPLDGLTDLGIDIDQNGTGSLTFTYDMQYDAATKTLTVVTTDDSGNVLKNWTVPITDAQVGRGYTLGVTAATAASHAAYTATFNSYQYQQADASLQISSTGLPEGVSGPSQTDVKAMAGDHVAFYPEGTTAPTTTPDGFAVTSAYAVPAIDGYVLRGTQFADIVAGDANQVVLNYGQPATTTVHYVDGNGQTLKPDVTLSGFVGDTYTATTTLDGYDYVGLGDGSAAVSGPFTAAGQSVTLVFSRPDTELAVKYVDEDGTEIQKPTTQKGVIGDDYTVTAPVIEGYDYVGLGDDSAALSGQFAAGLTVTLVYKAKPRVSGGVTVNYVDQDGNTLQPSTTQGGNVGDTYTVAAPTIDGYDYTGLGDGSAALSGQLTDAAQTVTLVYTKQATLTVRYVDGLGHEIRKDIVTTRPVGTVYTKMAPPIAGYDYVGVGKDSAPLSGTFTAQPQTITFVYFAESGRETTPQPAGSLTIRYVDENGQSIKADTVKKDGFVGNGYGVTAPAIDGYDYVGLGDGSAALSGQFIAGDQTITLVYKPAQTTGDLTVRYVDANGDELQPSTTLTGNLGSNFAVTIPGIKGYHYAGPGKEGSQITGTYTKESQVVTLTYTRDEHKVPTPVAAGDLTIRYVDEKGNQIQADTVKSGYVGNGYGVTAPSIKNYDYVGLGSDSVPLKGQFTTAAQTITLVYKHKETQTSTPVEAGDLTIRYVDEKGNQIQADTVKSGYVGNGYQVVAPSIKNYDYVGLGSDSAPLKGQFTTAAQTITLVYKHKETQTSTPVKSGDLTIRYVDEKGNQIQADTVKSGYVGNGYGVTAPSIKNYDYVGLGSDSVPLKGQFTTAAQTITLVYKHKETQTSTPVEAGDLTIRYVDEKGNQIQADTVKSGYVGNGYQVVAPSIKNYDYVGLGSDSAPLKGQFTTAAQTITLVYKHKETQTGTPVEAGSLTIRYVDEKGNQIQANTVKSGYVGNGYEVVAPSIKNYDYVGLGSDSAPLMGQFTTAAQTITLVYSHKAVETGKPVEAGDLTIRYVDEKGNQIQTATVKSGYVGNGYGVTAPSIKDYDYVGLGDGSAPLKGQFTTAAQTITLVYSHKQVETAKPQAAGDLTIRYVDEKGNQIQTSTVKSGYVGNGYGVTAPSIKDYDYVGLGDGSAPLKGQFTTAAQTITLVYKHKEVQTGTPQPAGALTVRCVDASGNLIQAQTVKNGYVGNGYGVTVPTIRNYDYFGLAEGSAALIGKFTGAAQTVTMIFRHKTVQVVTPQAAGDLTIRYVDEKGNQIQTSTVKSGYVGNGYGVTAPTIKDYDYVGLGAGSAALTGKFTKAGQTITLVYSHKQVETGKPVEAGDLTIRYVDEKGNQIQTSTVKSGYVGNGYGVTAPSIKDYDYVGLGDGSAALTGKFTKAGQTITLVYSHKAVETGKPQAAGDLTIRYVDEKGNQIQISTVKSGYVGNGYGVTAPTIKDYDYVGLGDGSAALTGKFTKAGQTITLVYSHKAVETVTPQTAGDLTIRYVDEKGNQIQTSTVKSGYVGNGYGVTAPSIKDYDYVGLGDGSAALTGKFTKAGQTITLVYSHKAVETAKPQTAGDLTIRYVDEKGNQIQTSTVKSGYVGNGYGVTAPTIKDYDYVGLGDGSAALTGKFTKAGQTITLVYSHTTTEPTDPTEPTNPTEPTTDPTTPTTDPTTPTAKPTTQPTSDVKGDHGDAGTTAPTQLPVTGGHAATTAAKAKALPQTGDQRNLLLQAMGALLLGLTGTGVMLGRRRRER